MKTPLILAWKRWLKTLSHCWLLQFFHLTEANKGISKSDKEMKPIMVLLHIRLSSSIYIRINRFLTSFLWGYSHYSRFICLKLLKSLSGDTFIRETSWKLQSSWWKFIYKSMIYVYVYIWHISISWALDISNKYFCPFSCISYLVKKIFGILRIFLSASRAWHIESAI